MPFSPSIFGSSDSKGSQKKGDSIASRSTSHGSRQSSEERFTDGASKSQSGARDDVEDVSSHNPTKLFSFVTKRNWTGAVKRCSGADKVEATKWIVEHNNDGSIRWRLLPIHQACENKAPSEVVKALIAAYPESLMMKDSGGYLPLHLACRERGSKAVIAALLSTEPGAAKIKDSEGRLPLHLACRQGVAVQVVDSLIVCHYRAARTPDSYSLIPLHWACAQNANLASVESLLRAHPDSTDLKDKWGRTPLSLAQASTNPEKEEVIKALLKEPSFWTSSLVDEIDKLKHKIDETVTVEGKANEQVNKLQGENAKLRELNFSLKEKVAEMSNMNKFSDDDIDKLNEDNSSLVSEVGKLKKKLNEFTFIFRSMEDQRKELMKISEEMEASLQQAVNVAGDDYLKWRDPLHNQGPQHTME